MKEYPDLCSLPVIIPALNAKEELASFDRASYRFPPGINSSTNSLSEIESNAGVGIPINCNFSLISNPSFRVILLPSSGGAEGCASRKESMEYEITRR